MTFVTSLAESISAQLREAGTPERAEAEARYLKSSLSHYGATVWQVRRAVRAVRTAHRDLDHDTVVSLAEELWRQPVHELRLAAAFVLEAYLAVLGPGDLGLLERLVRESRTWALVDVLAGDVVGALLLRDRSVGSVLRRWARDPDFWVRRAALLAYLLPLRRGTDFAGDFAAFTVLAGPMAGERVFFIRKAIGWVLREAAKGHPDEVYAWVAPRTDRLSGVTVREAVKYLSPEQRDAVLAAHQERRPV